MIRKIAIVFLVLFSLLGQVVAQEIKSETIKIGGIAGLSGPAVMWGEMASMGWRLAVEDYNNSRSGSDPEIEFLLEDSRSTSAGAVSAYQKLVNLERVEGVVGDVWDFLTQPLIPLGEKSKVLHISTVLDQSTHLRSQYFFTTGPTLELAIPAIREFFKRHQSVKRIYFLGWDNDWGYGYEKIFSSAFAEEGVSIIGTASSADFANDWRSETLKAVRAKPDAIVFLYPATTILKRLTELGFKGPLLTTSNVVEDLSNKSIPDQQSEGLYYIDWSGESSFNERFIKRFGKPPVLNAIDGYEGMRSMIKALKANRKDPAAELKKISYQGVAGPVNFSHGVSGNLAPAKLFVVRRGKGELVR
jgi:branched-chain amino acid transport system substrate-binding protein